MAHKTTFCCQCGFRNASLVATKAHLLKISMWSLAHELANWQMQIIDAQRIKAADNLLKLLCCSEAGPGS